MAIQRPHTRTNLPYCSALRLYTYWRSGAVFHAPGIPESRFPASRSWDCPQVSFLGIPWNSGQKSNDDIIEFPAAAGNGQRFKAVAICIQEHLPIMPGSDCTHTVFTDRAARWHAPVSHHWHRFAPAQRGAAGPRDTVLLLTAASSCMCAQAGGMREPLRPAAPSPANQAHTGRPRVQSTTTLRQSSRCSTSGFMQTTTTRSRMAEPKPSWLRAQVSACCPAVVRPGSCVPR